MSFEELYQVYFQEIYLYLKSISRSESVAEEITQETFFKALKSIHSFDGSKDIRAWLFTIAKNTYFSYYKQNKRDMHFESEGNSIILESKLVINEEAFKIHQFIHTMEEPYKEVFSLRTFGELPFEQIGLLFEKSSGWARVTYYRAKKKIIKYMEESGYEKY